MIERIEINLLPAEYRVHKRTLKISRSIVYPVLGLIILLFGAGSASIYMQNKAASLEDEIASLDREIQSNKHIQAEINKLRADKKEVELKIRALERINVNREKWVRLMEVFSGSLPPYSWLISIREDAVAGSKVQIDARTYSFHEVAVYMSKLEQSEFITAVELAEIERMTGAAQGRSVYRFSISCTVDPDAKLDVSRGEETDG
ncbi:MAG: PilN domain-containing protein [Chitinispirillales bacterium]|jgi:Tfp pilus assembly protein PilN|nr:PilN domain-containing protein [Chitinispirillales bacterium]